MLGFVLLKANPPHGSTPQNPMVLNSFFLSERYLYLGQSNLFEGGGHSRVEHGFGVEFLYKLSYFILLFHLIYIVLFFLLELLLSVLVICKTHDVGGFCCYFFGDGVGFKCKGQFDCA